MHYQDYEGGSPLPLMDNSSEVAYNLTPLKSTQEEYTFSEPLSYSLAIDSTESEFYGKSEV